MKLLDLEPELVRWEDRYESSKFIKPAGKEWGDPYLHTVMVPVETMQEAQGVQFLCPACLQKNGGAAGTHGIHVGFHGRGLLDHHGSRGKDGRPTRWHASGDGLHNLTLSPSVDCGCWHGHVTNGEIVGGIQP